MELAYLKKKKILWDPENSSLFSNTFYLASVSKDDVNWCTVRVGEAVWNMLCIAIGTEKQ